MTTIAANDMPKASPMLAGLRSVDVFPSFRQLAVICIVWATVAFYTVVVWTLKATPPIQGTLAEQIPVAMTGFYAIRAPLVGALAGFLWSPVFSLGYHPRRLLPGHEEGRDVSNEDTPWRHAMRYFRGAVIGQFVGATATFGILFLWPNEMQNTRWDAIKWGLVFWKLYWYLFVPAAVLAGVLSVWMAVRHRVRPLPPPFA